VFHKPTNPTAFIIKELQQLQKVRAQNDKKVHTHTQSESESESESDELMRVRVRE